MLFSTPRGWFLAVRQSADPYSADGQSWLYIVAMGSGWIPGHRGCEVVARPFLPAWGARVEL